MRLADDRRARVPFALVGVLLLLGSTTYAATLATQRAPTAVDRDVSTAMERAAAATGGALRDATDAAARDAARNPVLRPAKTSIGRVLNDSTAFRDALRIRIYHDARDRFADVQSRKGDVVAGPSLPATPNASALRRAKQRVHLTGVANGTALTVTVENVTITAREGDGPDGTVVGTEEQTITLTVDTPVLALHERTERYERRLNTGAVEGSGLGRRLTAELYAITWARGYAQYGGLPVQNVLGNHHVEVATNGGILREQRAVFGRADPDARAGTTRIALEAGTDDLAVVTGETRVPWARLALNERQKLDESGTPLPRYEHAEGTPRANDTMTVAVNRTAGAALVGLLSSGEGDGSGSSVDDSRSLDAILADAYNPEVRLVTASRDLEAEDEPAPDAPGPEWELVGSDTDRDVSIRSADGVAPRASVPAGFHRLDGFERVVVERHEVTRKWRRGNESRTTQAVWIDRTAVGVSVVGDHLVATVPERGVDPIHEFGGVVGGPNLRGVEAVATDELVAGQGGRDAVAESVVTGGVDTTRTTVAAARPDDLRPWVRADLVRLRDRVRNISVAVERGRVATASANPPERLAAAVRDRRSDLLSVPPRRYDGVADTARVAARVAYIDRVLARLAARAERTDETNEQVGETLADAGVPSGERLSTLVSASATETASERRELSGGPGEPVAVVPDGSPAVLTVVGVERRYASEVAPGHTFEPLAARTTNVFTVPSGEVAEGIIAQFAGEPGTVTVANAGRRLRQSNATLSHVDDARLRTRRNQLRRTLSERAGQGATRARETLARQTDLSARERRRAVNRALTHWNGTGERAIALGNGSLASAVAEEAVALGATDGPDAPSRGALESHLEVALSSTSFRQTVAVPESDAKPPAKIARQIGREQTKAWLKRGISNATELAKKDLADDALGSVPAGLPVAPVPGYWYATINVWDVQVRGQYARFTVQARTGGPTDPDAAVAYSRDGGVVRFDTDDDGDRERLGWNDPVDFEQRTAVVIAVPPNGNGVGDVDGNADERSPGWPTPGCRAQNCLEEGNASRGRFESTHDGQWTTDVDRGREGTTVG